MFFCQFKGCFVLLQLLAQHTNNIFPARLQCLSQVSTDNIINNLMLVGVKLVATVANPQGAAPLLSIRFAKYTNYFC